MACAPIVCQIPTIFYPLRALGSEHLQSCLSKVLVSVYFWDRRELFKGQKISKKIFCPIFFQKTNTGAILCTENCPSVRFLEESRTPYFAFEIYWPLGAGIIKTNISWSFSSVFKEIIKMTTKPEYSS